MHVKNRLNMPALIFIVLTFLVNIAQSGLMDLSHDEAYYWIYSLFPDWGYYDHPPMVGWMIAAGSIFGKSEIAVRFPFALMQAGALWLIWQMGGKRNFAVFALATMSMPLLVAGGFLALPDTPLMFFSALFLKLAHDYRDSEKPWHLVAMALAIAFMFYSKYHGLVVVLLTTAAMPEVLKRKSFWLTVGLVVVFFLPHVYWQYSHDFISIDFHLNKRSGKGFSFWNIADYLGGLFVLGGILAFGLSIYTCVKNSKGNKILLYNSIGFFGFVFLLSLRNRIEANWTVTAFVALVPLLCRSLDDAKLRKWFLILSTPAVLVVIGLRVVLALPYQDGEYPFERLAEVKGWTKKSSDMLSAAGGHPLYADTYQVASKLSFYGDKLVPQMALGSRESQFLLLNLQAKLQKDDRISFAGTEELSGSVEFEPGYIDPVFVSDGILLEELLRDYGKTYEEVIRN